MVESLESAILANVQGVRSVKGYENDQEAPDDQGRYPHSIEMVVSGGSDTVIAKTILDVKAGGIATYGDTAIAVPGEEGEKITIRFSRPRDLYVWYQVVISLGNASLPPDYVDIIDGILVKRTLGLLPGQPVTPQMWISEIYDAVPGAAYIDLFLYADEDAGATPPQELTARSLDVTYRQLAVTSADRIGVTLSA
jgi:hypothetical protein